MKEFLFRVNFIFYTLAFILLFLWVSQRFTFGGCFECPESPIMLIVKKSVVITGLALLGFAVVISFFKHRAKRDTNRDEQTRFQQ